MFVSMRWLARHVNLDGISPEVLCDDLTLSTAEVEGLERFAPQLLDVVVGHVTTCDKHPDAEKLSVCIVDAGTDEPLTIVCGAPNIAAGQKVAVAPVGTTLPGDFKIKKSKIRGVPSFGMICSVRELDLGDDHDGIWVLPGECVPGTPVAEALGVDDWIIEIDNKSLTHRPDLWGHRGIAREIAAIYERPLLPIDTSLPATGQAPAFPVDLETSSCSRYLGLPIDGVEATHSPDWLKWLLLAVGQRPIDLLVDLSNFVMLDLGQPNHAFDRDALTQTAAKSNSQKTGSGIVVRQATAGESIQTLDGENRSLTPSDVLICAGATPVALAGIMGGEASKVAPGTQSLLLEVATFEATTIRRTSSRLALRTDSSARFEKTLDPNLPLAAAGHFVRLLSAIDPNVSLPAPITDVGSWSDPASTLALRTDRVRQALGKALSNDEIASLLTRLDFSVTRETSRSGIESDTFQVGVPSFRATKDITIEQDLVEEIGRLHRYGNIDETNLLFEITPPPRNARRLLIRDLQDRLAGSAGFHESLSYSFIDDGLLEKLGELDQPHVSVINPVVQSQSKIRRRVLPSLLTALEANRRLRTDVRLFEIGKAYEPEHANEQGEPRERHLLALAWAGLRPGKKAPYDAARLGQLQAIVNDLLRQYGGGKPCWSAAAETEGVEAPKWAHPGKCLVLHLQGATQPIALLSEIEPGLANQLGLSGDLDSEVVLAEVCLDALLEAEAHGLAYCPLPKFPGIKVDVAVSVAETMRAGEVIQLIEQAGKKQVVDIELFDLYRGESIGAGKKSLAFHVLLQSDTKTLSDKDEQKFFKRFEALIAEAGGELRKG